jgi:hypothetical protein
MQSEITSVFYYVKTVKPRRKYSINYRHMQSSGHMHMTP